MKIKHPLRGDGLLEQLPMTFNSRDIPIVKVEVLRHLGYRGEVVKQYVEDLVEQETEEARYLIVPQTMYTRQAVRGLQNGIITLINGRNLNVGSASEEWNGCQYLGIAVCTIGMALENKVAELFNEQDELRALVLDMVGSVAVEALVDKMNYLICCSERKTGNIVGPRASPGYGRWHLDDQKVIFSLLPVSNIEVELNEQCMMIPRKSSSFCLGIGITSEHRYNPCRRCGNGDCSHRWSLLKSDR